MFFKNKTKINPQDQRRAGFFAKVEKEKASRPDKNRERRTPFSTEAVDTSFVFFEEN